MEEVGRLADLPDGKPAVVKVGGREVALVRVGGDVFALRNVCPHQTQSFRGGTVHDRVVAGASLGDIELVAGDPVVACPWHGYEYNLRTGKCAVDAKLRVRAYRVTVEDGRVLLDLAPEATKDEGS